MAVKNGSKWVAGRAGSDGSDGIIKLTYEESEAITSMVETPGDPTGKAYLDWLQKQTAARRKKVSAA